MPRLLRTVMAGALGLAAAGLVACGNTNGLLSSDQGSSLGDALSSVSAGVRDGNCARAQSAAARLKGQVSGLPSSVSPRLRANLEQAASTVGARAVVDCAKQTIPTDTRPKSTTTDSTPTPSTPTTTGPTTTAPPSTTTSTPTTPPTGTTPSTSGNGSGSGNGGTGNGGSGKGNGGGQGTGNGGGGGAPGGGGTPAPGGGGAGTGK